MKFLFQLHLHLLLITVPLSYMHATYANLLSRSFVQKQRCISLPLVLFEHHPTLPLHDPPHTHYYSQFSSSYVQIHSRMWSPPLPAVWLLLCSQVYGTQLNMQFFLLHLFRNRNLKENGEDAQESHFY